MKCSIYNLHLNYYSSSPISSASSISSFSFYLTTLKKLQKRRLVDSASLPFPPAPAFCCRFKRLIQSGEREAWPSVLFEMLSWFQYNGASSNCRAAPAWWGLATHLGTRVTQAREGSWQLNSCHMAYASQVTPIISIGS